MQGFMRKPDARGMVATIASFLALLGTVFMSVNALAATPAGVHVVFGPTKTNFAYIKQGDVDVNKPADVQFACLSATAAIRCYSPQQLQNAYTTSKLLKQGITGEDRTIVIIDAFGSPTIASDLKLFDKVFNLPNPTLTVVAPDGIPAFDPTNQSQSGWAGETTLDVEWAHAIAPGAAITLVEARSPSPADLLSSLNYSINNNVGDIISLSFGMGETCSSVSLATLHQAYQAAADKRITVFASSGDEGAALPACVGPLPFFKSVSTPASDPLVTGVGATQLDASAKKGAYIGEIALNETDIGLPYTFASGGGFSTFFKRPAYQDGVAGIGAYRGVPDVAYSGAVNGGVIVIESFDTPPPNKPHMAIVGGTSAAAPQWAAIGALADQLAGKRLGFLNKALYKIGKGGDYAEAFHDITIGNNTFHLSDFSEVVNGYNTRTGWDAVTGWGTPKVAELVPLLVQFVKRDDAEGL